jgi:hypothetical protein
MFTMSFIEIFFFMFLLLLNNIRGKKARVRTRNSDASMPECNTSAASGMGLAGSECRSGSRGANFCVAVQTTPQPHSNGMNMRSMWVFGLTFEPISDTFVSHSK